MKTTQQLNKFIATISKDTVKQVINDNNLNLLVNAEYTGTDKNAHISIIRNNRSKYTYNLYTLLNIRDVFCKNNIPLITFKGMSLAKMLYQDRTIRPVGDIDIYVGKEQFETAINLLFGIGFSLKKANGLDNVHHVVLTNKYTIIELHRHILTPLIGVSEKYLLNHTGNLTINKVQIKTFDVTATLLHLIYHLYMDTYLASNNIYFFTNRKQFGIAKRFIFRAYEIALFAEKYFKDIKWNDIISDIKIQKLRIVFKYMAEDILEIFPNVFPAKLVDVINSLEYVSEQNDDVYKIIRTAKAAHDNNVDFVLSKYIDENWNCNNTATCKHLGECFEISKPVGEEPCKNKTLSCELLIDRCEKGISLQFTVSDDDFYISDYNNFGTLESDGVHLLLCGTQKYTYMSIFLVPKIKNDSIEVFAYDVLNNTVIDSMDIQARIQKYDDYYILQAVLSNEFLSKHEIDKYFYVGFVISDCDRETKYRKNALISSDPETEWYNPLHFLKVDLLDY